MTENRVIKILKERSPLTGKELQKESKIEELSLWRICNKSEKITLKIAGRRYLRFDRAVEDYARLSPSIKREFLTYTICGLKENIEGIEDKAKSLWQETKETSRKKHNLAKQIISEIVESSDNCELIKKNVCFIIAGDIVFNMAHLEPRPERSTGKLVRGSDLDIVIVTEDKFPKKISKELDDEIYKAKYMYLIMPEYREEIDYIIKSMSKTKEQLKFDRFESMIASKLLYEGQLLYGNKVMFEGIKNMLFEKQIPAKLKSLKKRAAVNRKDAISYLLKGTGKLPEEECMKLFYTKEEAEEIF